MRLDALERLQNKDGKKDDDGASKATPVAYRDANPNPNPNPNPDFHPHPDFHPNPTPTPNQVAYRDANQYPTSSSGGGPLKTHQTFVDGKQEAVLIPIHGRLVPFHISTVKNVSKSEEGGWTFLRINFVAPGPSVRTPSLTTTQPPPSP